MVAGSFAVKIQPIVFPKGRQAIVFSKGYGALV